MHNINELSTVVRNRIRSVITNRSTVACLIGPFLPSDGKTPLRSLEIEAIFEGRRINLRCKTRAVSAFNGCGWFSAVESLADTRIANRS
jgi:hypothetical protein